MVAKSKPIRALRQFCSIAASGGSLYCQTENGYHRVQLDPDPSLCEQITIEQRNEPSWLAYCNNTLYARSPSIHGALAKLDTKTFEIKETTFMAGGGTPRQQSSELSACTAPMIVRESKDIRSPMCSDGRFLYIARFEVVDTEGNPMSDLFSYPDECYDSCGSEEKEDYNTDEDETKNDERYSAHLTTDTNLTNNRRQKSNKYNIYIDVIDPSIKTFPLVNRFPLSFGDMVGNNDKEMWKKCKNKQVKKINNEAESQPSSSASASGINILPSLNRGMGRDNGNPPAFQASKLNLKYDRFPRISETAYVDTSSSSTLVENGFIKSWTLIASRSGQVTLAVWRRVSKMQFELIGSNTLSVTIGRQTISIPIGEQIEFQSGDFIGAVESRCIVKMRSADSFTYQSKLDNRSQQQLENSGVMRFHAKGSKIGFAVKAHVVHECEDEFDNVEIDHFNETTAGNVFFLSMQSIPYLHIILVCTLMATKYA